MGFFDKVSAFLNSGTELQPDEQLRSSDSKHSTPVTNTIFIDDVYSGPLQSSSDDKNNTVCSSGYVDMKRLDPMFADVARFVVSHREGNVAQLQRKFEIGYNRAGKLSDQLEAAGIVGANKGPKGRDVLISDMQELELLLDALGLGDGTLKSYSPKRPSTKSLEELKIDVLMFLRKNINFEPKDELIVELIPWVVSENITDVIDILRHFDVDRNRAEQLEHELVNLHIWSDLLGSGGHRLYLHDYDVALMLCDYIKKSCPLENRAYSAEVEWEKMKHSIAYSKLTSLDDQFLEIAQWISTEEEVNISKIKLFFSLTPIQIVDILDQLYYARIIDRVDTPHGIQHKVLIHDYDLIGIIHKNLIERLSCGTTVNDTPEEEEVSDFSDEKCYVYLMHDEANGYHKIGISKDPEYRERTLQSEKPTIVKLCAKEFPTRLIAESIESALHKAYASKRLRGEWFNLDSRDVNAIIQTLS